MFTGLSSIQRTGLRALVHSLFVAAVLLGLPDRATAQVTILNPWPATPQISAANLTASSTPFVIGAGSSRVLLVAVLPGFIGTPGGALGISVSYGGRPLTQIEISDPTQRRIAWIGFLGESDIAGRSDNTVLVTLSNGQNLSGTNVYISSYDGVDQADPIQDSGSRFINNLDVPVALAGPVEVAQGGLAVFAVHVDNSANPSDGGADQFTFSSGVQSGSSGNYTRAAAKGFPVPTQTNVSLSYGTVRAAIVGATLLSTSPVSVPTGPGTAELRLRIVPLPSSGLSRVIIENAREGPAQVDVFDAAGRRVRRLLDAMMPAGPRSFAWDGRDEVGQVLGAGVYVVRATVGGESVTARCVRIAGH